MGRFCEKGPAWKLIRSLNKQDNHEIQQSSQDRWDPLPTIVDVGEFRCEGGARAGQTYIRKTQLDLL